MDALFSRIPLPSPDQQSDVTLFEPSDEAVMEEAMQVAKETGMCHASYKEDNIVSGVKIAMGNWFGRDCFVLRKLSTKSKSTSSNCFGRV